MYSKFDQELAEIDPNGQQAPPLRCVHKIFEFEAAAHPERIALILGGEKITYSELNATANQIAHYLLSLGTNLETPVGIAMGRSTELVACILGVLKAGAAYLPLDPDTPDARLSTILDDAKVALVVTTSHLVHKFSALRTEQICLDEIDLSGFDSNNPNSPCRREDLAYVMFTSGSTGRPKGVMIEHRSIVRLVKVMTSVHSGGLRMTFPHAGP